jgi:pimeloyl-ACP methyl ester carboxylesterase
LVAKVRGCLARNELLATGWRSFLSQEARLRGFKTCFQDQLGRIRAPVLQIHGAGDRLIPTWHGIQSQPLFRDSELEIIPACGHWLPREEPDLFCELVTRFLDQRGLIDS